MRSVIIYCLSADDIECEKCPDKCGVSKITYVGPEAEIFWECEHTSWNGELVKLNADGFDLNKTSLMAFRLFWEKYIK